MKITIIYNHEEMQDMVVYLNSIGFQKIMKVIMDENNIEVIHVEQPAEVTTFNLGRCQHGISTDYMCPLCGDQWPDDEDEEEEEEND